MGLQNPQAACCYSTNPSVAGREERQTSISSQQQRRSPAESPRVAGAWARRAPCPEQHLLYLSRQSSTRSFQRRWVWRTRLLCPETVLQFLELQGPSVSPEIEMVHRSIRERQTIQVCHNSNAKKVQYHQSCVL
jgi:hypothetical protein